MDTSIPHITWGGRCVMRKKSRKPRKFTAEFRAEAVKLMNDRLDQGVSLAQICRDLDLAPDQLRGWAKLLGAWHPSEETTSSMAPSELSGLDLESEVRRLRR